MQLRVLPPRNAAAYSIQAKSSKRGQVNLQAVHTSIPQTNSVLMRRDSVCVAVRTDARTRSLSAKEKQKYGGESCAAIWALRLYCLDVR